MLQLPFKASLPRADDDRHLFRWTGEFRDGAVERVYRAQRLDSARGMLRACGLVATTMFTLLGLRDLLQMPPGPVLEAVLSVRLLGLAAGLVFQLFVWRAADAVTLDRVGALGVATLTVLSVAVWSLRQPPDSTLGALAFAHLMVFYLLIPSSAALVFGNAALLSGLMLVLCRVIHPPPADGLVTLALFIALGNALGLLGMRQFKFDRRRSFLARDEARRVTSALTIARQESRDRAAYETWALDALQVGVLLIEPDGRIHTVNRCAAELLALPEQLTRGGANYRRLLEFVAERGDFGELTADEIRSRVERMVRGEVGLSSARHGVTGKVLEFTLNRLPDGSVALTVIDASDRYAVNRRLSHAVEVAGDGFAIYDASDHIAVCSTRFAAPYGLTADEAVGMSFDRLLARGFEIGLYGRENVPSIEATVNRRRVPERLIEIRTAAGETYLVHERLTPSGDLVVLRTNITARQRMEDELRASRDEAERALVELRGAQASLILAEKMASLGSLVAGMSHEISTPLGIGVSAASHLSGEVERLAARFRDNQLSRAEMEDFLAAAAEGTRIMQGNLDRAARLIQAFKQVAADQTADALRDFDLGDYIREVMLSLAPALRRIDHKVEIDCPAGLMVRQRPGALGQILTNLVLNAVQHGFVPAERPALLQLRVTVPRAGRITLEFRDNGRGIAAEDLPRIFDPFFTTRRGTGGTGLGLHIVYNLVNQVLGGNIAVSSRMGDGTRFTISFPQVQAD